MLRQKPHDHTVSPAQIRVTPQELSQALTALEARRLQIAETISIQEAVEQLGLAVTPEEVWAEVQMQRTFSRRRRLSRRQWLGLGVAGLLIAGGIGSVTLMSVNEKQPHVEVSPPESPTITFDRDMHVQDKDAHGPILRTLAEIPNDHPVLCTFVPSSESATGLPRFRHVFQDWPFSTWTIIKHDGKLYLRGWTQRMSDREIADASKVGSFSVDNGEALTDISVLRQVTLPVDQFKVTDSDESRISAADVHLDRHAWEKW